MTPRSTFLVLMAIAVVACADGGQRECNPALYASFSVKLCAEDPEPVLSGEGACPPDTLSCADPPTCSRWAVFAAKPGVCILRVSAGGREYSQPVELVRVRECPSEYGPADGQISRTVGSCAR